MEAIFLRTLMFSQQHQVSKWRSYGLSLDRSLKIGKQNGMNNMKVMAFNGSARKDGNTANLLNLVLNELKLEGIKTDLVQLGGELLSGCIACSQCGKAKNKKCFIQTDKMNDYLFKMEEAEGILLGIPDYVSDVTGNMKAFIERAAIVSGSNGGMFKHKVGAPVVAVRGAGSLHAFDTLSHFFLVNQMIIPGSNYWTQAVGREPGDVNNNSEGLRAMKTLGRNMAWLLKKLHG